jgi:hypothetical protein
MFSKLLMRASLAAVLTVFLPGLALAAGSQSDDITWVHPTQRVDATALPISEISRTEIEVTKAGVVLETVSVPAPATAYTWNRTLPPNYTMCYRARTVDTNEQASVWTAAVCKTVKAAPNPPGQMGVR